MTFQVRAKTWMAWVGLVAVGCSPAEGGLYVGPPGSQETHALVRVLQGDATGPAVQLVSSAGIGNGEMTRTPLRRNDGNITFPASYTIRTPGRSGQLHVLVEALDDAGGVVGRGHGAVELQPGAGVTLDVRLSAPCDADSACPGHDWCAGRGACVQHECVDVAPPCADAPVACVQNACVAAERRCELRADNAACTSGLCHPTAGCLADVAASTVMPTLGTVDTPFTVTLQGTAALDAERTLVQVRMDGRNVAFAHDAAASIPQEHRHVFTWRPTAQDVEGTWPVTARVATPGTDVTHDREVGTVTLEFARPRALSATLSPVILGPGGSTVLQVRTSKPVTEASATLVSVQGGFTHAMAREPDGDDPTLLRFSLTWPGSMPVEGAYQVQFRARDAAGNSSETSLVDAQDAPLRLVLDGTPPAVMSAAVDVAVARPGALLRVDVTLSELAAEPVGAAPPALTMERAGASGFALPLVSRAGALLQFAGAVPLSPGVPGALDGAWTATLSAVVDAAGNGLNAGAPLALQAGVTVDGTPPTLVSSTLDRRLLVADGAVRGTLVFSEPLSVLEVWARSESMERRADAVPSADRASWDISVEDLPSGAYVLTVLPLDLAGNGGVFTPTTVVVDRDAPTSVAVDLQAEPARSLPVAPPVGTVRLGKGGRAVLRITADEPLCNEDACGGSTPRLGWLMGAGCSGDPGLVALGWDPGRFSHAWELDLSTGAGNAVGTYCLDTVHAWDRAGHERVVHPALVLDVDEVAPAALVAQLTPPAGGQGMYNSRDVLKACVAFDEPLGRDPVLVFAGVALRPYEEVVAASSSSGSSVSSASASSGGASSGGASSGGSSSGGASSGGASSGGASSGGASSGGASSGGSSSGAPASSGSSSGGTAPADAACPQGSTAWGLNLGALSLDGNHALSVEALDLAGNTRLVELPLVRVDTIPPRLALTPTFLPGVVYADTQSILRIIPTEPTSTPVLTWTQQGLAPVHSAPAATEHNFQLVARLGPSGAGVPAPGVYGLSSVFLRDFAGNHHTYDWSATTLQWDVRSSRCADGFHDGGDRTCKVLGACSTGYRNAGDGTCITMAGTCAAGFHEGGADTCTPLGTCSEGHALDGGGDCRPPVYANTFDSAPTGEWNSLAVITPTWGQLRQVLTPQSNQTLSKTLVTADYAGVEVQVDLFVLGPWGTPGGPSTDRLSVVVDNGIFPASVTFTFSNHALANSTQSFPSVAAPGTPPQPARRGALESDNNVGPTRWSRYRLVLRSLQVSNPQATSNLQVRIQGVTASSERQWALDAVRVFTFPYENFCGDASCSGTETCQSCPQDCGNPDLDADGVRCVFDCDDADPTIRPGIPEVACNQVDENCDGIINEDPCLCGGDTTDADADGSPVCAGDCDDNNSDIRPGGYDDSCDGMDQDCSGGDYCDNCTDTCSCYPTDCSCFDSDGDGESACSDCNDSDPALNSSTDLDSDGAHACEDCNDQDSSRSPYVDADGDGDFSCTDCNDSDAFIYNGAPEDVCASADLNCDGVVNYDGCACDEANQPDNDGDGYNTCQDCNDGDNTVYPGASEDTCDSVDRNCDGTVGDGSSCDAGSPPGTECDAGYDADGGCL